MEMRASRPLAVSQQQAWEALNDPQALKACLAGCEKFEPAEDGGYIVCLDGDRIGFVRQVGRGWAATDTYLVGLRGTRPTRATSRGTTASGSAPRCSSTRSAT